MRLLHEIRQQPDVLEHAIHTNWQQASDAVAQLTASDVAHVVVAARGTSDNAARYAKYLWGSRLGLSVTLSAPSLYTTYHTPPDLSSAAVVAISQSGGSPDLAAVLEEARRQRRPTVVITNSPASKLANLGDVVVEVAAGEELSVAATKSYTAQLAAIAMIAAVGDATASDELLTVPALVQRILEHTPGIAPTVDTLAASTRCVVVGRGFQLATAHEFALKLQETCYLHALPFSIADFWHGPLALADESSPTVVIATQGPQTDHATQLLGRLNDIGAPTIAISNDTTVLELARTHLQLPDPMPEWLSPIPTVVACQLVAYHTASRRGTLTDTPRAIRKITETL